MRKLFLVFLFIGMVFQLFSQEELGVRMSIIKPYGYNNYVFKTTYMPELVYRHSDETLWEYSYHIGYYNLEMKQDSVAYTKYFSRVKGISNILAPAYYKYTKYWCANIGVSFDYHFMPNNFSPFAGGAVHFQIESWEYEYEETLYSSYGEIGGDKAISIYPRVGLRYNIANAVRVSVMAGMLLESTFSYKLMSFWKAGFQLTYLFNYEIFNYRSCIS